MTHVPRVVRLATKFKALSLGLMICVGHCLGLSGAGCRVKLDRADADYAVPYGPDNATRERLRAAQTPT
jgi:hypothetical protein